MRVAAILLVALLLLVLVPTVTAEMEFGPDTPVRLVAQTLPTGIDRVEADLSNISNIDGIDDRVDVDIAILDTGADMDHPDLNVVGGFFCIETSPEDGHGHGSHVSGTAAALDNELGVVGVAPGARIWAVKVLNSGGSGTFETVACGIDWVIVNAPQVDVISMSLGGHAPDGDDGNCGYTNGDVMHQAVCRAVAVGIVVVVAAGNNAGDAANFVPAAYDEVITVSAIEDLNGQPGPEDVLAGFSNWGADVDIAGPGVNIWSTDKNGGYRYFSGTSMATPHVAAAAAMVILVDGKPTDQAGTEAVKQRLIDLGAAQGSEKGFTGDRDAYPEPLLMVDEIGGVPTPPPAPVPPPPPPPSPEPITVTFINPLDGDAVEWKIMVHILATEGAVRVEFWVDGKLKASVDGAELVYPLQTQGLKTGTHVFTAVAFDAAGNTASEEIAISSQKLTGAKP